MFCMHIFDTYELCRASAPSPGAKAQPEALGGTQGSLDGVTGMGLRSAASE